MNLTSLLQLQTKGPDDLHTDSLSQEDSCEKGLHTLIPTYGDPTPQGPTEAGSSPHFHCSEGPDSPSSRQGVVLQG